MAGTIRRTFVAGVLLVTGACADVVTSPPTLNAAIAEQLLPSVEDVRTRMAPHLESGGVSERLAYDLGRLESAIARHDKHAAVYHLRIVEMVLGDYWRERGARQLDRQDITAIAVVLHLVASAIGSDFDIESFS